MREKLIKIGAFIATAGVALTGLAVELDLAGEWTLSGSNEVGAAISCPIAVPGDVHSALFKAKLISDPFWGCNETNVQWVADPDLLPRMIAHALRFVEQTSMCSSKSEKGKDRS